MTFRIPADDGVAPSRRRFVQGLALGGIAAAGAGLWPRASWALQSPTSRVLAGTGFDLVVGETLVNFTGRMRPAATINGSLPAPILRWREGTTVDLRVCNALPAGSIYGSRSFASLEEYEAEFAPLHPAKPWSAPAWQGCAVVSDPQIHCVQTGAGRDGQGEWKEAGCGCLSEQGTRLLVDLDVCEVIVRDGVYNPYRAPHAYAGGGEPDGKRSLTARPADASTSLLGPVRSSASGVGGAYGSVAAYGDAAEHFGRYQVQSIR